MLANKKTGGRVCGSILFDGKPRDASFAHAVGYVEQWDSHAPYSTVREALEFSGRLRLTVPVSSEELARRVDNTLAMLGISHLQHELIGGQEGVAGVSQEVRKKVTIGVELIAQPRLLYADEPTTGLDAAGAFSVCQALRKLANHIAVICTIHQPSSEIIEMFDSLLVMQPGGRVSYCHSVKLLPDYFASHQLGHIEKDRNVADFALEAVRTVNTNNANNFAGGKGKAPAAAAAAPANSGLDLSRFRDLPREFLDSAEGQKLTRDLAAGIYVTRQKERGADEDESSFAVNMSPSDPNAEIAVPPLPVPLRPFMLQLWCLLKRDSLAVLRNRRDLNIRFFLTLVMGIVVGTVFFRLGDGSVGETTH